MCYAGYCTRGIKYIMKQILLLSYFRDEVTKSWRCSVSIPGLMGSTGQGLSWHPASWAPAPICTPSSHLHGTLLALQLLCFAY